MDNTLTTTSLDGKCPLCGEAVTFEAQGKDLRVQLRCPRCAELYVCSIVRDRAIFHAIDLYRIDVSHARVHDIGPTPWGVTVKLQKEARSYIATNFWPDRPIGDMHQGVRNENAEAQTFADSSFDLVVSLDVMEHVNYPDRVFADVYRTLSPGGYYVFTTPTEPHLVHGHRAALYREDGTIHYYDPPEYHGDPATGGGSLLTWRFGYDLPKIIRAAADFDVTVMRFNAPGLGLLGYYTETYVCHKR